MEWDLLRTFATIARLGSLSAAARTLGVSQSTVSRHLRQLEDAAGSPLILREVPIQLTERGEAVRAALGPMIDAAMAAQSALRDTAELRGQVTVTAVGEIVRWVLTPALPRFYLTHPQLQLRLLADNQVASLAAGDADIAVRMARPMRGDLVTQKVRTETYGYFATATLAPHPAMPWLGLAGSLAHIPEQAHADRAFADRPPRLLVEDVESLGMAVAAGLGVAVLPRALAAHLGSLVELSPAQVGAEHVGPISARSVWMVVHRSKQQVPKIRAVRDWLQEALSRSE